MINRYIVPASLLLMRFFAVVESNFFDISPLRHLKIFAMNLQFLFQGLGTDDDALVEILCSRTNSEIDAMKEEYERLYKTTMEKDVKSDTSGDYQNLMVSMITSVREEGPQINLAQVREVFLIRLSLSFTRVR